MRWIGLLARLLLGGVLLVAGALKVPHPEASVTAVRAYQLLPVELADGIGRALPIVEVIVGLLLVLGVFTRWAAVVGGLLMVAFVIGIASVWARGISINCGCFGDGGVDPDAMSKYPWEIARDVVLLLAAGLLVWRPRTPFSLDSVLFPEARKASDGEDDQEAA
jgi:uncharacterized membrane protein YphA (DoxX/SURF4 family)